MGTLPKPKLKTNLNGTKGGKKKKTFDNQGKAQQQSLKRKSHRPDTKRIWETKGVLTGTKKGAGSHLGKLEDVGQTRNRVSRKLGSKGLGKTRKGSLGKNVKTSAPVKKQKKKHHQKKKTEAPARAGRCKLRGRKKKGNPISLLWSKGGAKVPEKGGGKKRWKPTSKTSLREGTDQKRSASRAKNKTNKGGKSICTKKRP